MKKTKALVLFSGGLDSRLVIKLLQEQDIEVEAIYFKLPFGAGCCNDFSCVFNYSQVQGVKLNIIDCTQQPLINEYLEIIKSPKHGTGTALNPCKDCKIFMFKKAKEFADKINADFIATGEVLGQRPMSQLKKDLQLTERKSNLQGKILRPLSAKLLPETEPEKNKLVDRNKLLDIQGRQRKNQIELAKKFKIKYPQSGGGCLLCEKLYSNKLKDLFKNKKTNNIKYEDILLLKIGKHFRNNNKIILGKNESENNQLALINKNLRYNIIIPDKIPGPTALFENIKDKSIAEQLIKAYSQNPDLTLRKRLEIYRIR